MELFKRLRSAWEREKAYRLSSTGLCWSSPVTEWVKREAIFYTKFYIRHGGVRLVGADGSFYKMKINKNNTFRTVAIN